MNSINAQLSDKLRSFTLYSFLAVSFFGVITGLPSDFDFSYEHLSGSSRANVIVDLSLLVMCGFLLKGKLPQLVALVRREKFLSLFLVWCLLTTLWSDFPFIVFKRSVRMFILMVCCLSFVINISDQKEAVRYLWNISLIYMAATLLAILFLGHAIDADGNYIGLTSHKNVLGQVFLVTIIIGMASFKYGAGGGKWVLSAIGLMLSSFLLLKTNSLTSISCTVFVVAIWLGFGIRRLFVRSGFANLALIYLLSLVLLLICGGWLISSLNPGFIESLFKAVGKDMTLTDRVYLWRYILSQMGESLWLGNGFNGFWVTENAKIYNLYNEFYWIPNQSHNGYLDLLNETGLVGFILVLLIIFSYARRVWTNPESGSIFALLLPSILLLNLSETTLFSRAHVTNTIFFIGYLWAYKPETNKQAGENCPG
jgi:O-antigen ligase